MMMPNLRVFSCFTGFTWCGVRSVYRGATTPSWRLAATVHSFILSFVRIKWIVYVVGKKIKFSRSNRTTATGSTSAVPGTAAAHCCGRYLTSRSQFNLFSKAQNIRSIRGQFCENSNYAVAKRNAL